MSSTTKCNRKDICGLVCPALFILPAILLGVLAMILGGVSPALWGQQLAAWVVFALLVWPMQRVFSRIPSGALGIALLIVLAAALFGEEAGGARRWIDWVSSMSMRRSWLCRLCLSCCAA